MEDSIKKALKYFKYSFILFSIIYWFGVIIDDWVFIEKYWKTNWIEYLGIWTVYFLIYSVAYTAVFWAICSVLIFIHQKIVKR